MQIAQVPWGQAVAGGDPPGMGSQGPDTGPHQLCTRYLVPGGGLDVPVVRPGKPVQRAGRAP